MKKEFHFVDVIGVMTMRILKPEGIEGIGSILCFMTDEDLDKENYAAARTDCLPELIRQFPNLDPGTKEMKEALLELENKLPANHNDRDTFIKKWLEEFRNGKFGIKCNEFLEVDRLPSLPKDTGIVYIQGFRGAGD